MARTITVQAQICRSPSCQLELTKLEKKYPVSELQMGTVIPYSDLAEVIGHNRGTSRFDYVIQLWKAYLLEHRGILLKAQRGVGYFVADYAVKAKEVHTLIKSIGKRVRKTVVVCASIDTLQLTETERKVYENDRRLADGLALASSKPQITAELPD